MNILLKLICYEIWRGKLGKYYISSYFSKFGHSYLENFIKNYKTNGNILKMYSLVKRLALYFIESNKTYSSYYLRSIPELILSHIFYTCCLIKWTFITKIFKIPDCQIWYLNKSLQKVWCIKYTFVVKIFRSLKLKPPVGSIS